MKLSKDNVFTNQILVFDPEKEMVIFGYECKDGVPRVLVSKSPEVNVQDFGDHCYVIPFEFESEEQFNSLALDAILKACELNKKTIQSLDGIKEKFITADIPLRWVLVSKDFVMDADTGMKLYKIFDEWEHFQRNICKVDGLKSNQMIFCPEAEFMGVVSVAGENMDKYGIGIMNVEAPVLVELP